MPLYETLKTILTEYPTARNEPLASHPFGSFIRHETAEAVEAALGELAAGFLVEGSAGAGNWAGGIDADVDSQSDISEEFGIPAGTSVTETRKYVFHRKIERNRTAARHAKKFHGTRCQACQLDFGERYGYLGNGFIEAHHLRPIATLEEGVPVKYDVAADFAVLCSNCHRMIYRSPDPSDLVAFRLTINRD